jgi:RNA polymerase sigma-70 factor (ECF subfamily)
MDDHSDEALMMAVGAGDARAFEQLATRHGPWATKLAARVCGNASDAGDIVQEALLRVWVKAPSWRAEPDAAGSDGQPRLARFRTWFGRILVNLSIDQRRRPTHADLEAMPEPESDAPSALDEIAAAETRLRLRQTLDALPERQRTALMLCQFGDISNSEAAAAMGVSVGALESLLVRARRALRTELADLLEDSQ